MKDQNTNDIFLENKELKKEIEKLKEINEEYLSYKVFINARKKFISWISIALLVFTVFGIISIKSLITTIKNKIEEKGTEKIIEGIKIGFIEKHQKTVTMEVIETINPFIEARIEELIRRELTSRLEQAEAKSSDKSELKNLSQAFKATYENEKYIIIAGSSTRKKDLENLLIDIQMKTGNDPKELFPKLYIRVSKKNSNNYMLILEENISYIEAQKARDKAIHFGFRSDTFFRNIYEP